MTLDRTLVKARTSNRKLGAGVGTTYRPVGEAAKNEGTCPSNCPFLQSRHCYAMRHLVQMVATKAAKVSHDLDKLLEYGDKYVRLHTSGDFFCQTGLDVPYLEAVIDWCRQHPGITVWTYTHGIREFVKHGFTAEKMPSNLHIVASCDSLDDKAFAQVHGFRAARVILQVEDKLMDETFCPYDYEKRKGKKPTSNCRDCQLCFNPKHAKDIAFLKS